MTLQSGDVKEAAGGAGQREPEPRTFEELSARLSEIVEQLERGELPLEKSLKLFEEGVALSRALDEKLVNAERRVEELLGIDREGRPVTRPLDRGQE